MHYVYCLVPQSVIVGDLDFQNSVFFLGYHLKNCLANVSANLNMACSDESLKHNELALLEAELSNREVPAIRCPRLGGVEDLVKGAPLRWKFLSNPDEKWSYGTQENEHVHSTTTDYTAIHVAS